MRSGKMIRLFQAMDRQDQSIAAYFAWSAGGILSASIACLGVHFVVSIRLLILLSFSSLAGENKNNVIE